MKLLKKTANKMVNLNKQNNSSDIKAADQNWRKGKNKRVEYHNWKISKLKFTIYSDKYKYQNV